MYNTPKTDAEIAQIHYMLLHAQNLLGDAKDKIERGDLVEASAIIRSQATTYQHLADRLDAVYTANSSEAGPSSS